MRIRRSLAFLLLTLLGGVAACADEPAPTAPAGPQAPSGGIATGRYVPGRVLVRFKPGGRSLAVASAHGAVVGARILDDVYVLVSNFLITPWVGVLPYAPNFTPDPREVAAVIEVPLAHLRDPAIFREEDWSARGYPRIVQFYCYGEHQIWGATGRVIQRFLASPLPERVSQIGNSPISPSY